MSWFFLQEGSQAGPVEGHELYRLVQTGRLPEDAPVRRDSEQDWKPFRDYFPRTKVTAVALPLEVPAAPAATPAVQPASSGLIACDLCGKRGPADELLEFEALRICAECKPRYFQELREGVARPAVSSLAGRIYGGFWRRTAAFGVDVALIFGLSKFILLPLLLRSGLRGSRFTLANLFLQLMLQFAYFTVFHAVRGATPGKTLLGLQVVNPDGSRIGWLKSFARYFAHILSRLTLGIGCVMAAFDDEKRALHDRLCNTRVIRPGEHDDSSPSTGIPPRGNDYTSPVI